MFLIFIEYTRIEIKILKFCIYINKSMAYNVQFIGSMPTYYEEITW
jgi:hypothetical protein